MASKRETSGERGKHVHVTSLDIQSLGVYLKEEHKIEQSVIKIFSDKKIDGKAFINLTKDKLEEMGIATRSIGQKILVIINSLKNPLETKVFNDSIHGHIELHPLCVKIIDTPQFQRLRYIRQMGGVYFVYPGASHNRFEHSLGVCYLAGQLVTVLRHRQPELNITDQDILCVQIAGLCHDLGHGPFSHMFDCDFIPMVDPDCTWKHEDASVKMFDHLVKENKLVSEFEKYELTEKDREFIKEQVAGPLDKNISLDDWKYRGRGREKGFLYEVVANKRNGIDVDKWDYFARDCHHLGFKNTIDHYRFIKYARVIEADGQLQICCRDKEAQDVYDMFWTRHVLHRRACQHKVSKVIENIMEENILEDSCMISEAFVKANDYVKFRGEKGEMVLSKTIYDMTAYSKVTDQVFHTILFSEKPELEESRSILQRVQERNVYRCVGQTQPNETTISKDQVLKMENDIATSIKNEDISDEFGDLIEEKKAVPLQQDDIVVIIANMDYGMEGNNPVENVRFYTKSDPNKAEPLSKKDVSMMLPSTFSEQYIRVHCKKSDPLELAIANLSFRRWCQKNGMEPDMRFSDPSMYRRQLEQSRPSSHTN